MGPKTSEEGNLRTAEARRRIDHPEAVRLQGSRAFRREGLCRSHSSVFGHPAEICGIDHRGVFEGQERDDRVREAQQAETEFQGT